LRRANELFAALVEVYPDVLDYRSGLVGSLSNLGMVQAVGGDRVAAEASLGRAIGLLSALAEADPTAYRYRAGLAGKAITSAVRRPRAATGKPPRPRSGGRSSCSPRWSRSAPTRPVIAPVWPFARAATASTPPAGSSYCCNQRGDNIAVFRVDRETGSLAFTGHYAPVGNPSSIVFLALAKVV